MYVYDCNDILTTAMKNRSDKDMIRALTYLTEDLKIWGIHQGFHFMDREVSTALNLTMTTINIKYQLVPPINHIVSNVEKSLQTFKSHFIAVLWSVYKYFIFNYGKDSYIKQQSV